MQELVLPAIPYQEQAQYFAGDVLTLAQRMGAAIVVMVITAAKAPLIAAGAFTAPILWPWGQVCGSCGGNILLFLFLLLVLLLLVYIVVVGVHFWL